MSAAWSMPLTMRRALSQSLLLPEVVVQLHSGERAVLHAVADDEGGVGRVQRELRVRNKVRDDAALRLQQGRELGVVLLPRQLNETAACTTTRGRREKGRGDTHTRIHTHTRTYMHKQETVR